MESVSVESVPTETVGGGGDGSDQPPALEVRRACTLVAFCCTAAAVAGCLVSSTHGGVWTAEFAYPARRVPSMMDGNWLEAVPKKSINLIEEEESDGDGTHTLLLGHEGVEFGSSKSWHHDVGGKSKVPVLNAVHLMDEANPMDDGPKMTFFVCHQHHDIGKLNAMQITKVEPQISRIPGLNFDNSVVHHMSLFLCTEDESKNGNIGRCEEGPKPVMPHDSMHRPCYRMAYTYDRDAIAFEFPKDVGVRVGAGTPYTRIVQEWHYLLPKKGLQGKKFTDRSQFKVTLTNKLRKHNAAILAMMNMAMTIPPGEKSHHWKYECGAKQIKLMLKNDLEKYGKVTPFAVHLHSHNRGKKLWLEHHRNGKKIGEFGRFPKYTGYGPDESWMHLEKSYNSPKTNPLFKPGTPPGKPGHQIQAGDALQVHCVFDTSDKKTPTLYGTNHGEEMCGHILMYYPHDWTRVKHHEDKCVIG